MKLRYVVPVAVSSMALLGINPGHATDAFNLVGRGPVSESMGGIGAAYDIGPGGMLINPATLMLLPEGSRFDGGLDIITADLQVKNLDTGEKAKSHSRGRNNGPYYAPELSFIWRQGRYALGVGAFASDGVGTQFGANSFLSRTTTNSVNTGMDVYSRLLVMRIPFSAAFQVTDKLAIGGSVDVVWTSVNLGLLLDTTQIGGLAARGQLSGTLTPTLLSVPGLSGGYLGFSNNHIAGGAADSWGIGGRLGLTYQATADTRLGLAYNFKTHVGDLTGGANLTAISAVAGDIPLEGRVRLRHFEMPAQLTAGISQRLSDRLTVAFDYQRVFWRDVLRNINVGFVRGATGGALDLKLPTNYRDTNAFALGLEYRYNTRWTFRGGLHYTQQAVPGTGILAIVPSTPTTNITGGFSYAFGTESAIDFALAYGFRKNGSNSSVPNTSVPIQARHGQTVGAVTYTKRF